MSATVSVRVPVKTRDTLAAMAKARGVSLAEAIADVTVEAWWADSLRQEARVQSLEWADARARGEIEDLLDASAADVADQL